MLTAAERTLGRRTDYRKARKGDCDAARVTIRPSVYARSMHFVTHFISVLTQRNSEKLKYPQDIFHNTILNKDVLFMSLVIRNITLEHSPGSRFRLDFKNSFRL
jgi:hypothetical protein